MKNKKFRKLNITINILVIFSVFFSQAPSIFALNIGSVAKVNTILGVGSPVEFMDVILEDIGMDKDELRSNVETFNTASRKKTPPQVSLFFSPTDPEEGEKITVTASPSYFLNDPKDLYYTWFLKNERCEKCNVGRCDNDDLTVCDLNNDRRIDIEDYKIKATRIIVNGGFNSANSAIYNSESDNDGYRAYSGGNDQKEKDPHCFIHDSKTGEEYSIDCGSGRNAHLFPNAPGHTTGNNAFGKEEEEFWQTDPNSNDTARLGNSDEANVAGLGVLSFTWNYQKGDKVGVAIEGVSTDPAQTEDASYKTMWAMSKKVYDLDVSNNIGDDYPQTTTTTTTTLNSPLVGQTTTITTTTNEDLSGIVNELATIETVVTTRTVVTSDADGSTVSDETTTSTSAEILNFIDDDEFDVEINDEDIDTPSDLNDLLYDALVSPQENTPGSNKLDISLSYSPTNPINDPGDENGDMLIINSSIPNAKDTNYLQYKWEIYASNEVVPSKWGDPIFSPLILKDRLKESTQTTGLGIDTFKFRLALKDNGSDKFSYSYLRVLLKVTENVGEDFPRVSSQDILIPIISIDANDQIQTFSVLPTDSTDSKNLSGVNLSLDEPICDTIPTEQAICPVTKNQIVGLSLPSNNFPLNETDFLWTVDGNPISYSYCFFEDCKTDKQINTAYFPILKEVGEQYSVNLIATSKDGEKINLTKTFRVVDPTIEIISADTKTCDKSVLGKYIDVNEQEFYDYSKLNFWAYNSADIKLTARTNGFSVLPQNYTWNIDGETIDYLNASTYGFKLDSNGNLTLPPKEVQGESYNLSVGTLYTQNNLTKKALKDIWGVTYDQFYEKIVSDDAVITMMNDPSVVTGQGPAKKIFASIYSSTPAYLAFLLRIVLTISLILFTTKLVFSFSPENKTEEY